MKKYFLYITLFSWAFLSFQSNVKTDFLARLKHVNQQTTSLTAQFKQEKKMAILQEPIQSEGTFSYLKPNYLTWQQQTPEVYEFTLKEDQVILNVAGKKTTLSANNPQVAYFKTFLLSTLDGSIFESTQFESTFEQHANHIAVTLIPTQKQLKKRITSLQMVFDHTTLHLQSIKMNEAGDDYTLITFYNVATNTINQPSFFD